MSGNLVKAGFAVFGYDPVAKARATLAKAGGTACESVTEVARNARFLVRRCPARDAHSTTCNELARACTKGLIAAETMPCPNRPSSALSSAWPRPRSRCSIARFPEPAPRRAIAISPSMPAVTRRRSKPSRPCSRVFSARYDVGAFGNGTRMKLVANLLVAIHNLSTAEAILMGARSGLDPAMVVKVVADGAGGSRMFQVRGPVMVDRSWGEATMKVSTWQKDMRLINDMLQKTDTPAPLFAACMPIYNAAMALGHGGDDTAAVYWKRAHDGGGGPRRRSREKASAAFETGDEVVAAPAHHRSAPQGGRGCAAAHPTRTRGDGAGHGGDDTAAVYSFLELMRWGRHPRRRSSEKASAAETGMR